MRHFSRLLPACLLLVVLAACGGTQATPTPEGSVPMGVATAPAGTSGPIDPQPEPGKGSIKGRVLNADGSAPLANTTVRFSEVYRQNNEAVFVLDEARSPGGYTDEQGNFVIPSIEAREYVMVVGDVYGKYVIVAEAADKKKVWSVTADQVLDTGDVKVDLNAVP